MKLYFIGSASEELVQTLLMSFFIEIISLLHSKFQKYLKLVFDCFFNYRTRNDCFILFWTLGTSHFQCNVIAENQT